MCGDAGGGPAACEKNSMSAFDESEAGGVGVGGGFGAAWSTWSCDETGGFFLLQMLDAFNVSFNAFDFASNSLLFS